MTAQAAINVSVSSHYREATYASEVISQGILGERVEILEPAALFSKIRQNDGYISWISTDQLCAGDPPAGTPLLVRSHFVAIRKEPAIEAEIVRDAVIGCTLPAGDRHNGWYRVTLPDGERGWAEEKHFGSFPAPTPASIIRLAREFSGYQYVWGGRTPKGFDCSGLVQTVFGLHGVTLPRDSRQQQKHHLLSDDYRDAEPGDLLFFGNTPGTVTHVAISLGDRRFIHASGWVRYNSFRETDKDFSREHLDRFISVNRYPFAEAAS